MKHAKKAIVITSLASPLRKPTPPAAVWSWGMLKRPTRDEITAEIAGSLDNVVQRSATAGEVLGPDGQRYSVQIDVRLVPQR